MSDEPIKLTFKDGPKPNKIERLPLNCSTEEVRTLRAELDTLWASQPCPKCAEKDAEIVRLKLAGDILQSCFDGKVAEIARLKKAIPGSDEFEEKVQIVSTELSDELRTERNELKAKLETARKAFYKIYTDNSYSRDWHICAAISSTIEDALKQIGE